MDSALPGASWEPEAEMEPSELGAAGHPPPSTRHAHPGHCLEGTCKDSLVPRQLGGPCLGRGPVPEAAGSTPGPGAQGGPNPAFHPGLSLSLSV